ncbi:unnamed protein product [Tilletia caries]|nr:unnamed protein product [Tilletia controversa]CAD6912721.1 unnamed protein product [Tilletia caries]
MNVLVAVVLPSVALDFFLDFKKVQDLPQKKLDDNEQDEDEDEDEDVGVDAQHAAAAAHASRWHDAQWTHVPPPSSVSAQ